MKTIKTLWISLVGAIVLSGCQAQPLTAVQAPAAQPVAAEASAERPLKTLSENQVRRILAAGDSANIWGVSYSQTYVESNVNRKIYYSYKTSRGERWGSYRRWERNAGWNPSLSFAGNSSLTRLAHNRYHYKVPTGQVLVLNNVEGHGSITVNGFVIGTAPNQYGIQKRVHYLFGPGEEVVLNFNPAGDRSYYDSSRNSNYQRTTYKTVVLSGFTVSPSLLGSMGLTGPK